MSARLAATDVGFCMVVLALMVGCRTPPPDTDQPADSTWVVAPAPSVVLGVEPEGILFESVSGAARLPDGSLVVADGGLSSARLLMFAPDGRYVRSLGRSGRGPGEFVWVTSLDVGPNDSLLAFDTSLQRLTVFTPDGRLARTAPYRIVPGLAGTTGKLFSVSRLMDGTLVGQGAETFRQGPPGELVRDTVAIGLLQGSMEEFRPIVQLPARMTTTTLLFGRPVYRVPPFSPIVIYTTWGNCVFASDGETPSIRVYSSSGELINILTGPGAPRRVTQEHLERRLDFDLTHVSNPDTVALSRLIADEAHPTHLPFYHQILADESGHLWLQEYAGQGWGTGRHWYVMSQLGEVVGEVEMPKAMYVYDIRDGVVFGRTWGDFLEHRLELFELVDRPEKAAEPLPECAPIRRRVSRS